MKLHDDAKAVIEAFDSLGANGVVYTFGNGGSCSIADHMACDWMKGTDGAIKVISLSSNGALLSATANDLGYDQTCYRQLKWLANVGDVVVLVSSSGSSKNIIKAAKEAKRRGCKVIGFTGFSGGELRALSDVSVHISALDYGEIEDYHANVMHEVLRQLKEKL